MEEGQPQKKRKTIKWDEETIREHDKERGTRMKIDEPKTPFEHAHSSSEEAEQVNPHDVQEALELHQKHQQFCEKRRQHYNEFQQMKALQKKLAAQQQQQEREEELEEEQKEEQKEERKQERQQENKKESETEHQEERLEEQQIVSADKQPRSPNELQQEASAEEVKAKPSKEHSSPAKGELADAEAEPST